MALEQQSLFLYVLNVTSLYLTLPSLYKSYHDARANSVAVNCH